MSALPKLRRRHDAPEKLSPAARDAVIDRLYEECDLLCLGIPTAWRIEQAIAQAQEARA